MKRAARICPTIGCPNLLRGKAHYCSTCTKSRQKQVDERRPSAAQRGYGAMWRSIRAQFLKYNPQCACGKKATEVHHKVALADGGSHDWSNLEAMCQAHHSQVTAAMYGGFGNPERVGR